VQAGEGKHRDDHAGQRHLLGAPSGAAPYDHDSPSS
jgi:hypothetical protein